MTVTIKTKDGSSEELPGIERITDIGGRQIVLTKSTSIGNFNLTTDLRNIIGIQLKIDAKDFIHITIQEDFNLEETN